METNNTNVNYDLSKIANGKRICLLDLNYTLVSNQAQTRMLKTFSRRMEGRGVQNGPHRRYQGRLCYYRYCKT